jgi:hypothetical protein
LITYLLEVRLHKGKPLLDDAFNVAAAFSLVAQYCSMLVPGIDPKVYLDHLLLLDKQVSASASQKILSSG